jgi:GT2 family glycosyltransferase
MLRLTDKTSKVAHIPQVLYHCRQHSISPALTREAKPYRDDAGFKAVNDAVARRQFNASVHSGPMPNTYRIAPIVSGQDSAAIIVPTRNPRLLSSLLESLSFSKAGISRELHVVLHSQGNRTDEAIAAVAAKFGAHLFTYRGPFNFGLMINLAATRVSSRYLVLMNDDVVVRSEDWLEHLCAPFMRPEVGITGALLYYPDGTIEHSGIVTGIGDGVGHAGRFQFESAFWPWLKLTRNVSAVTGACLAIRRSLFEQLGGFDTRFYNNYNDVDLCLRAQNAGFEVVLSTTANLCHLGGKTRTSGTALRERLDFWRRWGSMLSEVDYFYNPNLSRRLETIELSAPSWQ